jgi:thiamine biosynthesis lipoprotein
VELYLELRFEAIGTAWAVDIYEPIALDQATRLEAAVRARIDVFDQHYSRFRPDSLITAMATTAGRYELPDDAEPLFDLYRELYDRTAGAVTPLIGQTLSDAGYDATYTLGRQRRPQLTPPPRWDEVLTYEYPRLTLERPALLDLGAAGKGYLVDLVCALLEQRFGLTAYCVDAGGDLRYHHPAAAAAPPLRVGLEHPEDATQVIGVAELPSGTSLCGSGTNRRAWGEYHHIMSPHTLDSPRHLLAVWTVASTTLLADALTTALFLVDAATLTSYYDFEYALVGADHSLEHSPGFPAAFFTVPSPTP